MLVVTASAFLAVGFSLPYGVSPYRLFTIALDLLERALCRRVVRMPHE